MNITQRRKARRLALQAIYQWQFDASHHDEIIFQFKEKCNPKKIDCDYFYDLVSGVIKNIDKVDKLILPNLIDRELKELNPVERAVIRLAVYELHYHKEIPYKVVINEALELTKKFGSEEGFKYVNGVLDKIARGSDLTLRTLSAGYNLRKRHKIA